MKKLSRALAILAVTGTLIAQTQDPNSIEALTSLAKAAQAAQDYPKAREAFLQLTKAAPQDSTAFYAVGAIDWIMVFNKQAQLPNAEKSKLIEEGLDNLNKALQLNPVYLDAMTYTNLLLREKAGLATDPAEKQKLLAEADQWFNKALAARASGQGVVAGGIAAPPPPPPHPPPPPPPPPGAGNRIGGDIAQQNLIARVNPTYPPLARAARVQDYVMFQANIDKTGAVSNLTILHGHPLLNEAALDAVKQWKYLPFVLGGQPAEVVTTITVNFSFQ